VLDDDLVVGDEDPLHDQPQDLLLGLECRVTELGPEPLADGRDGICQRLRPLRLRHLAGQELLALVHLLPRLAQALPALLQLGEFDRPDLVGVEQALLLPFEGRALLPEPLELALRVGELGALAVLLLAQVAHDERGLAQQGRDMVPHDRLDVWLADAAQLAAPRRQLGRPPARAFVAPARLPGVAAQPPPAVAAIEQAGQEILPQHLARRPLAVQLELARGHREEGLADERRPGHRDPLLRRAQAPAGRFRRPPRPPTLAHRLRRVHASIIVVHAGVEAVGEDLVHA